MVDATYEEAMEKAKVKRVVVAALGTLPAGARRSILADLMVELDEPGPHHPRGRNGGVVMPIVSGPPLPEPRPPAKRKRVANGGPSSRTRKRPGRQKTGPSKGDTICAALKGKPQMPIADLAALVYPEEQDAKHKVRAALFSLKKLGRVKNVATGRWEAA
jgi:hypothetical protein